MRRASARKSYSRRVAVKIHDETRLRREARAVALTEYERRWGAFTSADEATIDVTAWQRAWKTGRDVERRAQRHIARVRRALADAVVFVQACRESPAVPIRRTPPFPPPIGLPMGEAAHALADAAPSLLRALERFENRIGVGTAHVGGVNPAEEPTRGTWLRHRLDGIYYRTEGELAGAPRAELAVLALVGGWWPPKATGRAVTMRGMTVAAVIAHEGDLMHRVRARILRNRRIL